MNIEQKFEQMGARVKVVKPFPNFRGEYPTRSLSLDVQKDKKGTFFQIRKSDDVEVQVLDVRPDERHLLVMARIPDDRPHRPDTKPKFLCGHDERDWFVAGISQGTAVSSVSTAMEALKPREVLEVQSQKKMKGKDKKRRKTEAYIRQGEWFFVRATDLQVDESLILKNEPLRRGAGKPHMAEFAYRRGGEAVWFHAVYAKNGISPAIFKKLDEEKRKSPGWRSMVRDAEVFVKGTIRHADHKTVCLDGWYRVLPNSESRRNVAFLD
jgi:hypothetical protein